MNDDKKKKNSYEEQFINNIPVQEGLDSGAKGYEETFKTEGQQTESQQVDSDEQHPEEFSARENNRSGEEKVRNKPLNRNKFHDFHPAGEKKVITERKILSIRDLLYIFFKHLNSIIIITLVAVILSTLYVFTTTPLYTSDIKMLVQIGREKFAELEEANKSVNYSVLFQERRQNINNELQIFKEDNLTKQIYPELRKWLEEHDQLSSNQTWLSEFITTLKSITGHKALTFDQKMMLKIKAALRVEFLPESDIIRLSFTWDDPEFAAFAVEAYASEFIKARSQVFQAKKSYKFYMDQIALYQKKLNKIIASLRAFTKKWNLTKIDLEKELILRSKDQLENKRHDHKNRIKKLYAYLAELKNMYEMPDAWIETPQLSENEMIDKQAYLQDLDRQYFTLKLKRDQLLDNFTPGSREIRALNKNIDKLRKRKYISLKNIIESKIYALQQVGNTVEKEIAAREKRLGVLNQAAFIYSNLKLREKVAKKNLLMYTSKAESLRIYDDRDKRLISSIKIMNKPLPPLLPSYPKKLLIIVTTSFLGLFISFGFAAISEYFSHVFRDEYDIESILELPLLMSIMKIDHVKTDGTMKRRKEEAENK